MATNFYKQGGSYYRTDTGNKILNLNELQGLAKAGGKEIKDFNVSVVDLPKSGNVSIIEPPKNNASVSVISPTQQQKIAAATSIKPTGEVSNVGSQLGSIQKSIYKIGEDIYDALTNQKIPNVETLKSQYAGAREVAAPSTYSSSYSSLGQDCSPPISQSYQQRPTTTSEQNIATGIQKITPINSMQTLQSQLVDIQSKIAAKQTEAEQAKINLMAGQTALEGQGRAIPLSLVRGQQAKLQTQAGLDELTKATELAGLQRQEAGLISQLQAQQQLAQPLTVGNEMIRYNPDTGQYETIYRGAEAVTPMKVGAGETIINPMTGQIIYQAPAGITEAEQLDLQKKQLEINKLQQEIESSTSDIDRQIKQAELNAKLKELSGAGAISPYQVERSYRTIQTINELIPQIAANTTGWGAFLLGKLPTTEARYFAGQLNTLKSNIAFNELTAMREASKTGGALGQVSDREGRLLEASFQSFNFR